MIGLFIINCGGSTGNKSSNSDTSNTIDINSTNNSSENENNNSENTNTNSIDDNLSNTIEDSNSTVEETEESTPDISIDINNTNHDTDDDGNSTSQETEEISSDILTNVSEAKATLENAQKVQSIITLNQSAILPILKDIDNATINQKLTNNNFKVLDETEKCSSSGNILYSTNLNENNHDKDISIIFNQCHNTKEIINGSIEASYSDYNTIIEEYHTLNVHFTSDYNTTNILTQETLSILKGSSFEQKVSKFDFYDEPSQYQLSLTIRLNKNNELYELKDTILHFTHTATDRVFYQTQGRVYINNLMEYVSYDTAYDMSFTPFKYEEEILMNGEARYIMEANSTMKVTIENSTVLVSVDTDNDDEFEVED
jgi:uncharacterized protein YaaQ/flagellar hook-basal body complex protein FliE